MPGPLLRIGLIALISGCGARVDPFAADRTIARAAAGPPHLALAVGDPLLLDVAQGLLPQRPIVTPGPFGMPIEIVPAITGIHLEVRPADVCADCVDVDVTASGTARLTTALLDAPSVPWRVRAGAPIRFDVKSTSHALDIGAQWGALPVRSAVELSLLPPTVEALASGFVGGWLENALTELLREQVHLLTLDTSAVPLSSLRAIPGEVTRVDAYLSSVVEAASLETLPDPGDGWVLVVPVATAVAIARHNARGESEKKYFIEPTVIRLDGASLTAQIRIWRGGRKEHYKSVLVEGIVSIRQGDLIIEPTLADSFASTGWRGGFDTAILESKLRKWVEKGEIRVSGTLPTPAGDIRIRKIVGEGDNVVIRGTFEPRAMKSP
mgnify:CR=1 FL=1